MDKYVHLAFVDDHPMLYSAKKNGKLLDSVWLKIDSSVLLEEKVRFSSDVSNKSGVAILNAKEAKEQIDFEVLFANTPWKDPALQERWYVARKSEILVPDFIPIQQILDCKNG